MSDVWARVREAFAEDERMSRLRRVRRVRHVGQGVGENIGGQAGTGAGSAAQDFTEIGFSK